MVYLVIGFFPPQELPLPAISLYFFELFEKQYCIVKTCKIFIVWNFLFLKYLKAYKRHTCHGKFFSVSMSHLAFICIIISYFHFFSLKTPKIKFRKSH